MSADPKRDTRLRPDPPVAAWAGQTRIEHPRSRYYGKTVAQVAATEPEYLTWYLGAGKDERLKSAIRVYFLAERRPELLP